MTLFVGALLRTIEFVMVTTDASSSGPGSAGAAAAGSGAAEQRMRAEARDTGGGGPARRAPGAQGRCAPRAGGGETGPPGRLGPRCWRGRCPPLSPWTTVQIWAGFINRSLSCWTGPPSWCPGGLFFPLPLGVRGLLILSSDNLTSVFVFCSIGKVEKDTKTSLLRRGHGLTNSGLHFSTPHAVLLSLCPLLWRECLHAISLLPASPFFVPWHLPQEALLPPQRRMPGTWLPLSRDSFLLPPPLVAEFHGQSHFQFIPVAVSVCSVGTGRAQV